jgi:3-oxoacid CoA-transferase
VGGFGVCGIPINLTKALVKHGPKDLTVYSNDCGLEHCGPGLWVHNDMVKSLKISYVGENKELERKFINGEIEVEFTPQGTLAEKIRSGGAGIPGFYTPTGVGTIIQSGGSPIKYHLGGKYVDRYAKPKESKIFHGVEYILEESIVADFAFVRAWKGDTLGNLIFRKSARNFNEDMATAAKTVIAEVEELYQPGELDPNEVHVPSVYVDRVVECEDKEKLIEALTINDGKAPQVPGVGDKKLRKEKIVRRAAKELKDGMYVNLGIGIPTLTANYIEKDVKIILHSENGFLGLGPFPLKENVDPDLVNAGKQTVTIVPGGAFFPSSRSFGIIRGSHLDCTFLGGMQVSREGDLANWIIPGKKVKGMGGAMDLVARSKKVVVLMDHTDKGEFKIMEKCKLPITGRKVVNMLITDMAVFVFEHGHMILKEIAEGVTLEQVRAATDCEFDVVSDLKTF